jgi:PAS domain S-box-containing protein
MQHSAYLPPSVSRTSQGQSASHARTRQVFRLVFITIIVLLARLHGQSTSTGALACAALDPSGRALVGVVPHLMLLAPGLNDQQADANRPIVGRQTLNYEPRITLTYLFASKVPQLWETILHLPIVVSAANAPLFVMFDSQVGQGREGRHVFSYAAQSRVAAEMAIRILKRVRPKQVPVEQLSNSYLFACNALQRWVVKHNRLPPASLVLNSEPSLWERGQKYFVSGIVVVILQSLLICGLFWQRARKRRVEAMLRESEQRFRLVANNAPVLIWMSGEDRLCTYFNEAWLEFTGRPFEAELGNGWVEGVHPDDLQDCLETYTQSFDRRNPFQMEYRLRRHDGVFRWITDLGVPRFNADGSFAGYIGSAIDVTDRKLAHEALQRVSGQLIEAQEKERRRIARDLHDDICQKLALLSIELRQAHNSLNVSSSETKDQLEEIRKHCSGIALDVQSLSHQLHSSRLEYLGLTAAVSGFCRELAKQHELNIDFKDHDLPKDLPRDISLCLFRVAQEALHNAVKYSGVKRFEVKLDGARNQVQLVVSDAGAGFDVEEAKKDRGLGLVSMQERMNLVNGRFHIESKIGEGTIVVASVPLTAEDTRPPSAASLEGAA